MVTTKQITSIQHLTTNQNPGLESTLEKRVKKNNLQEIPSKEENPEFLKSSSYSSPQRHSNMAAPVALRRLGVSQTTLT